MASDLHARFHQALAAQAFDALDALVRGFEAAARHDGHADLRALIDRSRGHDPNSHRGEDDHLYGGLLTVLLRLVFLLYAEDRGLLFTHHARDVDCLSVRRLFDDLQRDHGAFADATSRRYGAWPRLLALFRGIHDGVRRDDVHIPARRGELFDPLRYPFLESWQLLLAADSSVPADMARARVPSIDDQTVYRVLDRLMVVDGQRLSYGVLDVEQIGSVYEALMGYGVVRLVSPAVCCRHRSLQSGSRGGVWIEAAAVLAEKPSSRARFLRARYDVVEGDATKIAVDLQAAVDETAVLNALERISLAGASRRGAGQLALQPGEERRRTGSHYTPRSLSEPIVRRTLEPLLAAMTESGELGSERLLRLKVCDPAMGSGAFLVATCRFLADHVVAAWEREGRAETIGATDEDVLAHARRLVAQRCVYGVDRNRFAVSLARMSLWLVTLARDEPFTFVDHALRHGDSLVGLSFEQIRAFHWAPGAPLEFIDSELATCVDESLAPRQPIVDLAGDASPGAIGLEAQQLQDATDARGRARILGDLVIGAFFEHAGARDREAERTRRLDRVRAWLDDGGDVPDDIRAMSERIRARLPVFHWWLEFPEMVHPARRDPLAHHRPGVAACMDAFVGNPPFAGKNGITRTHGVRYPDWLKAIHPGSKATADLCAHFFRRAAVLLGERGTIGLIATRAVCRGDTRVSGLEALVTSGLDVYDATRAMPWPGDAAVTVSVVHLARGVRVTSIGRKALDGREVRHIDSRLSAAPERGDPEPLRANAGKSFVGSYVCGKGFFIDPEARRRLCELDPDCERVLRPFVGGAEVNQSPTQSFHRHVINFRGMSLAEAQRWPALLAIVRERVKPGRDRLENNPDGRRRKQYWWQFGRLTPGLDAALEARGLCLVTAIASKHVIFSMQPTDRTFSHQLQVFPLDRHAEFAVLQSRVHRTWAWLLSATYPSRSTPDGIAGIRYSSAACFATMPFPPAPSLAADGAVEQAGRRLYAARTEYMNEHRCGLTDTYNALADPNADGSGVSQLRDLHRQLDAAVLSAYGWQDVEPPPYTDPLTGAERRARETFEDQVTGRLFALNAERAAQERPARRARIRRRRRVPRR